MAIHNETKSNMEAAFEKAGIDNSSPDVNNGGPQPQPAYQEPQFQPGPQPQPTYQETPRKSSFSFGEGGMFGSPISHSVGSDVYLKLKDALLENYKQLIDSSTEMAILDLDNANEPALAYSCLIVAMRNKVTALNSVSIHILILEATGEPLSPIIENINGRNIEVMRVTSDALDDVLIQKAGLRAEKAFPNSIIHIVDACVVPRTFNVDDKYAVHKVALNAGLATGTELAITADNYKDLNLSEVARDSSLNINLAFTKQQLEDAVGNKMRSDLLVTFESVKNNQQNRYASVNSGDRELKISELSGFVDLIWAYEDAGNPYNAYSQYNANNPMPTQRYASRMVITNLTSSYSYTIGSLLLNLTTALSVNDDNNWIQAFRPNINASKEIDLSDIGALNIEANLYNEPKGYGTAIDTKSDGFKLEDLGRLVSDLIRPNMVMSLDIPECGPQYWYLSVFDRAANGSTAAYNAIYDSANELTNGLFANYFPYGTNIFIQDVDRIHNGYWTDKDGQHRDIRDIDHLAVCNLVGENTPQYIKDWSNTFLDKNTPLIERLDDRKKMISLLTYHTAVFTGFSTRVTFTGMFLSALSRSIKDTGVGIRTTNHTTGNDFNSRRPSASFINDAIMNGDRAFNGPASSSYQGPHGGYGPSSSNYRYR